MSEGSVAIICHVEQLRVRHRALVAADQECEAAHRRMREAHEARRAAESALQDAERALWKLIVPPIDAPQP